MPTDEASRRFHFLREIASGTFGSVYLAKEIHSDGFSRIVAIKLLHRRWSESEEVTRRIRDEARLLGWLRHRNIVEVMDLTAIDGRAALVMEYLEAADLHVVAEALKEQGTTFPLRAALETAAAVAAALDAAYNRPPYPGEKPLRVIHRDIKPSNVMVDDEGQVKVLDFGVARADFEARESRTRELQFGSINYMPPERLFFEPETPASDVYSLGATLFEILALEMLGKAKGRPDRHFRFVQDRLSTVRQVQGTGDLGAEVEQLVAAMLAWDHAERPEAHRVAARCRDLARQAGDVDLHDWACATIPPIVARMRESERPPNPLNDQIVSEDHQILRGQAEGGSGAAEPAPAEAPPTADRGRRLGAAALAALRTHTTAPPVEAPATPRRPVQVRAARTGRTAQRAAPPQPELELLQPSRFAPLPLSAMESIPPIAPIVPPEPVHPAGDIRARTGTTKPPTDAPEPHLPRLFPGGGLHGPEDVRITGNPPRPVRRRPVPSSSGREFASRMTPPGEASPTAAVPPPLPGPPPLPAPGPPPVITLPAASPPPIPPGSAPSGARIGLVAAAAMLLSAPVLGALGGALVFNVLLPRVVLARQAGVAPIAPGPPDPPATGSGDPP